MFKKVLVCGMDEAGRGPLAGPLVAASVILTGSIDEIAAIACTNIKDGKLMTRKNREKVYVALRKANAIIEIEIISVKSINNHGIGWANIEIFKRLIRKSIADNYLIDGKLSVRVNKFNDKIQSIVDADAFIPEVILAGIVAKVERDRIMSSLHARFPHYLWNKNAGYGTTDHLRALIKHGSTPHHRKIFVQTAMNSYSRSFNNKFLKINSTI